MNYYRRHIGDYLRDTSHLSLLEHGVYSRLLDVYYTREEAIPTDQAARLIGARSQEEREAVDLVLQEFFVLDGTEWRQTRCDREIDLYSEKAERNRAIGRLGGRPRKPTGNPDGFQAKPTDNPSQEPIANSQEPVKKKKESAATRLAVKPPDVPDGVWHDFQTLRKAKKAPLSDTALRGIAEEAGKAGVDLTRALSVCCKQGWQGFNAGWYANLQPRKQSPPANGFHPPSKYASTIAGLTGRDQPKPQDVIDVADAQTNPRRLAR